MKKLILTAVCFVFMLLSCDCDLIQRCYDFSKVKTVRVERFSLCDVLDYDAIVHDGIVDELFVLQLLDRGYNVVFDKEVKVDAVIEGSITKLTFFREKNCCFEQALVGISAYMMDVNIPNKKYDRTHVLVLVNREIRIMVLAKQSRRF